MKISFWVTRFFWGDKRIDLAFRHQRCLMSVDKEKGRTKAPAERHVFYCKSQMNIDLGVGSSKLGNIAQLELIIIFHNSIDILPRWGKIL